MLVHLLQLGGHVGAVHIIGVAHMVHPQVVPYQYVPVCRLSDAWHQILHHHIPYPYLVLILMLGAASSFEAAVATCC